MIEDILSVKNRLERLEKANQDFQLSFLTAT